MPPSDKRIRLTILWAALCAGLLACGPAEQDPPEPGALRDGLTTHAACYRDLDEDGYGAGPLLPMLGGSCPPGSVMNRADCDDSDWYTHPRECYRDDDGDGYGQTDRAATLCTDYCEHAAGYASRRADCDDSAASVHPYNREIAHGVDDDCDDEVDEAEFIFLSAAADPNEPTSLGLMVRLHNAPEIIAAADDSRPPDLPLG